MAEASDNSGEQFPEKGDDPESSTHQDQDDSDKLSPEDVENMVRAWLDRYRVIDFDSFIEITFEDSDEAYRLNPPQDGRIHDLNSIPRLEEFKQASNHDNLNPLMQQRVEMVASRVERAFYILIGAGILDFLWTGETRLLYAMLAFFAALLLKLLGGYLNN